MLTRHSLDLSLSSPRTPPHQRWHSGSPKSGGRWRKWPDPVEKKPPAPRPGQPNLSTSRDNREIPAKGREINLLSSERNFLNTAPFVMRCGPKDIGLCVSQEEA